MTSFGSAPLVPRRFRDLTYGIDLACAGTLTVRDRSGFAPNSSPRVPLIVSHGLRLPHPALARIRGASLRTGLGFTHDPRS